MFALTPYTRNRISYYDPFRDLDRIEKEFFGKNELTTFKTDIKDTGKEYQLIADLPGFKKEDIKIDINGEVLSISAERKEEKNEKDEEGKYIYRERSFGSYSRSFDISSIEAKDIQAAYTDGVLTLTLPKKEEKLPETRHLEIH